MSNLEKIIDSFATWYFDAFPSSVQSEEHCRIAATVWMSMQERNAELESDKEQAVSVIEMLGKQMQKIEIQRDDFKDAYDGAYKAYQKQSKRIAELEKVAEEAADIISNWSEPGDFPDLECALREAGYGGGE